MPILRLVDPDDELGMVRVIKQKTGIRIGASTGKIDVGLVGDESSQFDVATPIRLQMAGRSAHLQFHDFSV